MPKRSVWPEVAEFTGESLTAAIAESLRQQVDRLRRKRGARLANRLLAIGKDCAPRLKEPFPSGAPGDLLYDEMGPK